MKGRYSPELLDHFRRPRNIWDSRDVTGLHILECGEQEKGEVIRLYIVADNRTKEIKSCWFMAAGSVEMIGIASWVTVYVRGMSVREVRERLESDARKNLELFPSQWRITKWLVRLFDRLDQELQI